MGSILYGISVIIKVIVFVTIHIAISVIVNNLHKSMYNKNQPQAWIPLYNLVLLGKLTFNETIGYILLGGLILSQIPFGRNEYGTMRKLPIMGLVLLLGTLLTLYAIAKAVKIKQGKLNQKTALENPTESFKIVLNSLGDDLGNMSENQNNNNNNNKPVEEKKNVPDSNTDNNIKEEDNNQDNHKYKFIDKDLIESNNEEEKIEDNNQIKEERQQEDTTSDLQNLYK